MFRSICRCAVAVAFVLALVLSSAPAQAQPRDFGSSIDASWIEVALSWLGDVLGGGDSAPLQGMEASTIVRPTNPGGNVGTMIGSCMDPWGIYCGDNN